MRDGSNQEKFGNDKKKIPKPTYDLTQYISYSLNFLREKIFTDFTDFCQTTNILTLKFLSSIAIQYNTSVIHEIFIRKTPKFTNPRKYSPSKNLGYTVRRPRPFY